MVVGEEFCHKASNAAAGILCVFRGHIVRHCEKRQISHIVIPIILRRLEIKKWIDDGEGFFAGQTMGPKEYFVYFEDTLCSTARKDKSSAFIF